MLLILIVGLILGVAATIYALKYLAKTDEAKRQLALLLAEQRIKEAQTKALFDMADATESALHRGMGVTNSHAQRSWPSTDVVNGTATDLED